MSWKLAYFIYLFSFLFIHDITYTYASNSAQDMEQIRDQFWQKYSTLSPQKDYLYSTSVNTYQYVHDKINSSLSISDCESWSDLCLVVQLLEEPPQSVVFPLVYDGAQVFYQVSKVTCPPDVRVCLGGSKVYRQPPDCEFSLCPKGLPMAIVLLCSTFIIGIGVTGFGFTFKRHRREVDRRRRMDDNEISLHSFHHQEPPLKQFNNASDDEEDLEQTKIQ